MLSSRTGFLYLERDLKYDLDAMHFYRPEEQ
jgi:hypothetical protein